MTLSHEQDLVSETPAGGRSPDERTFRQLLLNTLVSGVTSSFLWFALTFWVYLETRSVVATGVIGGAFAMSSVFSGLVIGGLGMGWAYYGSVIIVAAMLVHLRSISIDEAAPVTDPADSAPTGHVDIPVVSPAGRCGTSHASPRHEAASTRRSVDLPRQLKEEP